MKKFNLFLISILIGAIFFAGCGKNEKKTSLLTGTSGGQPASQSTTASVAANCASMAAKAAGGGVSFAPHLSPSLHKVVTGLGEPDAEGYYTFGGYTGTTMKLQFLNSSRQPIMNIQSQEMLTLKYIHVVLVSQYAYGTFNGDFTMLYSTSSYETMESGTITTSDPVGGTFTATITNMIVEKKTVQGAIVGVPLSGSMTISGSSGYTGTNTYSTVGSVHKCEGPIYYQGQQVAYVYLTFNETFGNYTGYYIDASDASGTHHTIE
ncbi:MAG: hypothetical protein WC947_06495 [Elusimicrobiota bacterium]